MPSATPDPSTDAAQRDRTPNAKAAIPNAHGTDEPRAAITEVFRPVGHHVVKPATHEAERHSPQRDVVDDSALATPGLPPAVTDAPVPPRCPR